MSPQSLWLSLAAISRPGLPASVSEAPPKAVLKKVLSFKGFGKKADPGTKAVNPESVIPLDDKDFKNF